MVILGSIVAKVLAGLAQRFERSRSTAEHGAVIDRAGDIADCLVSRAERDAGCARDGGELVALAPEPARGRDDGER